MERLALKLSMLLAGVVPVTAGGAGVIWGKGAFGSLAGRGRRLSHRAIYSGLLLAIGLAYWACAPAVERRGPTIRLLTLLVVVGGLARLAGWVAVGIRERSAGRWSWSWGSRRSCASGKPGSPGSSSPRHERARALLL